MSGILFIYIGIILAITGIMVNYFAMVDIDTKKSTDQEALAKHVGYHLIAIGIVVAIIGVFDFFISNISPIFFTISCIIVITSGTIKMVKGCKQDLKQVELYEHDQIINK